MLSAGMSQVAGRTRRERKRGIIEAILLLVVALEPHLQVTWCSASRPASTTSISVVQAS